MWQGFKGNKVPYQKRYLDIAHAAVACGLQVALAWHTWNSVRQLLAPTASQLLAGADGANELAQEAVEGKAVRVCGSILK